MFRAGNRPGEAAGPLPPPRAFAGDHILMADVSEFQPQMADKTYLDQFSKAIIIRAMYGSQHDDGAWYGGERRATLLADGAMFLGIYQYVTYFEDAAIQARALARLLGSLNQGEYVIADIEEGGGDQQARWQAWAQVISGEFGFAPGNYSGLYFAAAHGLQPVDWVAAYGQAEPAVPHKLWQFTDAYDIPGVGTADCSVFHGTIGQLQQLAFQGSQPKPAPSPSWTEALMQVLPTLSQGATGPAVRTVQALCVARGHATAVDAVFGPATRTAVEACQRSAGVTADGVCGPVTWAYLVTGSAP